MGRHYLSAVTAYAEGDNFRYELDARGVLRARVWRRPDLDSDRGAALGEEMSRVWIAASRDDRVFGLVFDLREAPPVFGPRTEKAFTAMFDERSNPKWAVLVAGEVAVQSMQLQRIANQNRRVVVVTRLEKAEAIAEAALGGAPPSSRGPLTPPSDSRR
jgi:hypothetical protein